MSSDADTYSIVLSYITTASPSRSELADWMIERKNRQIGISARNVLDNQLSVYPLLVPLQVLSMVMLYPSLDLKQLLIDLEDGGAAREDIVRAQKLISAFEKREETR